MQRERDGDFDHLIWDQLKALMKEKYVMIRYKQGQLTKLYNLTRGGKSMEDYYEEFQNVILQFEIIEPPNHCTA